MQVVEIDLISLMAIDFGLLSAEGSELSWFWCGGRKWLFLGFGSKLIWCSYGDRNSLVFCAEIVFDLVFVGRSKMTWFGVWIEVNFVFVSGDRNGVGRKLLGFQEWIEIDSVFFCRPLMPCFLCLDRWTWFLCGWSKMTWFLYAGKKLLFRVSIEIDLVFVWIVEIDSISVWGIGIDFDFTV